MSAVELETTVHGIVVQARHQECGYCGAGQEQPCDVGWFAVHLCRVCLAAHDHAITYVDAASVIAETASAHEDGLFAGWSLVFDTEVTQ